MDNFKVYIHTTPDGKRYVGITKLEPKVRWNNGKGYSTQDFKSAIDLFGWENILHEIVGENLTKEQAWDMETFYITKYKTTDRKFGYNTIKGNSYKTEPKKQPKGTLWKKFLGEELCLKVLEYCKIRKMSVPALIRLAIESYIERG